MGWIRKNRFEASSDFGEKQVLSHSRGLPALNSGSSRMVKAPPKGVLDSADEHGFVASKDPAAFEGWWSGD